MRQPPLLRRARRPPGVDPRVRPAQLADLTVDRIELVRQAFAAFRDKDLETLLAIYHPDAVTDFTRFEGFPEAPIFRGPEGLAELLDLLTHDVDLVVNEPGEAVDLGDGRVFVETRSTIRGAASGIELDAPPVGQINTIRDGLIARVDNYSDVAEARKAAGLPPKA